MGEEGVQIVFPPKLVAIVISVPIVPVFNDSGEINWESDVAPVRCETIT